MEPGWGAAVIAPRVGTVNISSPDAYTRLETLRQPIMVKIPIQLSNDLFWKKFGKTKPPIPLNVSLFD